MHTKTAHFTGGFFFLALPKIQYLQAKATKRVP